MANPRQYSFLRFADGVDWQHVRPELLTKLNRLGMLVGKVITVISGYRSNAKSQSVGGFAGDPHTRHIAVDATVNGKAIGSVISLKLFKKVGLISGNQPNFYNGKPDPGHVQLPAGEAQGVPVRMPVSVPPAAVPAVSADPTTQALVQEVSPPSSLPDPSQTMPGPDAPGSIPAQEEFTRQRVAATWQSLASQPLSSPETQVLAQNAQAGIGG